MAKHIKLKGDVDRKLKIVEIVINRMMRRLHKRIVTVMPPVPVSFFRATPDEDGIIFKWMCPGDATLSAASMFVGEYEDKELVEFGIVKAGDSTGNIFTFKTHKELTNIAVNLKIDQGDRITLRCMEPEKVRNIWIAYLITFEMKDASKKTYLLDTILADVEEETEEITEGLGE